MGFAFVLAACCARLETDPPSSVDTAIVSVNANRRLIAPRYLAGCTLGELVTLSFTLLRLSRAAPRPLHTIYIPSSGGRDGAAPVKSDSCMSVNPDVHHSWYNCVNSTGNRGGSYSDTPG